MLPRSSADMQHNLAQRAALVTQTFQTNATPFFLRTPIGPNHSPSTRKQLQTEALG
jgi:hypothetical protein